MSYEETLDSILSVYARELVNVLSECGCTVVQNVLSEVEHMKPADMVARLVAIARVECPGVRECVFEKMVGRIPSMLRVVL